jgi:hypothetical protein
MSVVQLAALVVNLPVVQETQESLEELLPILPNGLVEQVVLVEVLEAFLEVAVAAEEQLVLLLPRIV